MARATHENNVKIYFATTVASVTAPTAANISAGTNLTAYITKDGVNLGMSENMVDNAAIDTAFDAQSVGSYGSQLSLTLFRDNVAANETASLGVLVRGTKGFLIRAPFGTVNAGSKVDVFPVEVGVTQYANSAANENQKATVNFAVTSQPGLNVTVA